MDTKLDIPSFTEPNKPKKMIIKKVVTKATELDYVALTDEDIEACRKGQDIFDFARDIEEVIRVKNKL
jgi:hypothetical protein